MRKIGWGNLATWPSSNQGKLTKTILAATNKQIDDWNLIVQRMNPNFSIEDTTNSLTYLSSDVLNAVDDPSLPFSLFLYGEELDKDKEPEIWVMVRAWYGIVSTGGQAGFALDKLTEMLAERYPGAYRSLREDRYVDDILSGEDSKQFPSFILRINTTPG